ncbi:MAG TPA: DUF3299 domain-containing protein, partial [Planctomycetaceae bacterium]
DPAPRTAAEAGRGVFRSDTGGSPAGPTVPEPVEIAERTLPAEPVAAPKPETKAEPAGVALASAEIPSVSAAEIPAVIDPAADPSRYPGGIVPASPNAQPLPGGPRLLVPERTFRLEGRPRALRVTYDDLDLLRVLNMGDPLPPDVVDHFPDWLKDLDGKTIRLRGFMYPSYEQELSRFILTRDTGVCCFGPNPKVYYLVGVKLKEGTTVRYIGDRPFDVVGTFHIDPVYSDGQWYQLYKITDATVVE